MTGRTIDAQHAFHGGRFFAAVGTSFDDLGRAETVISADVLDAWFDPSPRVLEKLHEYLPFLLRTSPPVHGEGLKDAIAAARNIPPRNLCLGGGSSQLIFTVLPALASRAGKVLILDPMYGEYAHLLENVLGLYVRRHYLREEEDFQIDTPRLFDHIVEVNPGLVILVNPNNPTGRHWPRTEILALLGRFPDTLCLVDETYIDFVGSIESVEGETSQFHNLVVLKSMSKAYALSGARVGYLAACESIVRRLAPLLPPWSVSLPAQVAAIEALQDADYYQSRYRETHDLRRQVLEELRCLDEIEVYDSCTNSYLLKTKTTTAGCLQSLLEREGVFVRHCDSMSHQFHDDFLRIAVKQKKQNDIIVAALKAAFFQPVELIAG